MLPPSTLSLHSCLSLIFSLDTRLSPLASFDHFRRAHDYHRRNRQAKCRGGLEIDHQFKLRRLLDGTASRLGHFQNLLDKNCRTLIGLSRISTIRHQAPLSTKSPLSNIAGSLFFAPD